MIEQHEEDRISRYRRKIEEQYEDHPTGCGGSFGEILCYELHVGNLTFIELSRKWDISLPSLGELIYDHCCQLQEEPAVAFQ